MKPSVAVMIISLVVAAAFVCADDATARAGRGGSGGGRSQAAPARVAPETSAKPAVATPAPADRWRTTAGWLAGGVLGGLLLGGSGDGIGIPDVAGLVLLVLLAYIARKLLRRRASSRAPAFARMSRAPGDVRGSAGSPHQVAGLSRPAFFDPSFDKSTFAELASAIFAMVQQARAARDVQLLSMVVTPEMHAVLRRDCERIKPAGRAGQVGRTEGRVTGVGEARVEAGHEEITVRVEARENGDAAAAPRQDVAGETLSFAEDWTFTRPRWAKAWRLSAIQPAAR
jgi:predicted lipid-binding transport protein (Tim44 family)